MITAKIRLKSDTASNWAINGSVVLLDGEAAVVRFPDGSAKLKIGDGTRTFDQLPYATGDVDNQFKALVSQDGGRSFLSTDELLLVNIDQDEYYQLVADDEALSNAIYEVSGTYRNMFDMPVRNVAEPSLSGDAATKNYVDVNSVRKENVNISYDSVTHLITLDAGGHVSRFSAADFIKDGMVSNVSCSGRFIVITFNTDAGRNPISVDLSSLVDVYEAGDGILIDDHVVSIDEEVVATKEYVDGKVQSALSTTWSGLLLSADEGNLTPGATYRIVDYVTEVDQEECRSAHHQFDVVVTALSESELDENASVVRHDFSDSEHTYSGEGYELNAGWWFDGREFPVPDLAPYLALGRSALESWKIKYCLKNDSDRFKFADTENGKGVIYWMQDEWGNEAPYDFKNVQFKRYLITDVNGSDQHSLVGTYGLPSETVGCEGSDWRWCYTFDVREYAGMEFSQLGIDSMDFSNVNLQITDVVKQQFGGVRLNRLNECYGNIIKPMMEDDDDYSLNNFKLPNNVFHCQFSQSVVEGFDFIRIGICAENKFGYNCYSNTFGDGCFSNAFGNYCYSNTFGDNCYSNTFGHYYSSNTFGNTCYSNTFGDTCFSNTFGDECNSNTFENYCNSNTFGDACYSNTFKYSCYSNTFRYGCNSNTFGDICYSNTFEDTCYSNTFGDGCHSNTFGDGCHFNTFGDKCNSNTFGDSCDSNTFGDKCNSNTFGDSCDSNTFGDDCSYLIFSSSGNNNFSLIQVESNICGTSDLNRLVISDYGITSLGRSYVTSTDIKQYLGKDSYGNIVKKNPFDSSSTITFRDWE